MIEIKVEEFPEDFFQRRIEALASGQWVQGPAREFHQKFLETTSDHLEKLKYGGSNRGVTWPPFSRHSMGKERPSGRTIGPDSLLLFDTGRLWREAGAGFATKGNAAVEVFTNLSYAKVHNEGGWTSFKMRDGSTRRGKVPARPFQFFTSDDADDLSSFTLAWLMGADA